MAECLDEPWLDALRGYLGQLRAEPDPVRRDRRLSIVRHLAALFARYGLHRPEMVSAWAAGEDGDGDGGRLPPGSAWQAQLWRALRARIALPSPAERLDEACARLREDGSLLDLPPRVALFGLTRLPAGDLHVLRALAAQRDVHLFLLHPSPALWERIAAGRRRARSSGDGARARSHGARSPPTRCSPPGDATRARCSSCSATPAPGPPITTIPLPRAPATALGHLQAALLGDQAPAGRSRSPASPIDAPRCSAPIAASRSTPATARPARSRSYATPSCTCWPPTPRWSPAT